MNKSRLGGRLVEDVSFAGAYVSEQDEKCKGVGATKNGPPPMPDGREGRLFPPEQSCKSAQLLAELKGCRNKFFSEFDGHGEA